VGATFLTTHDLKTNRWLRWGMIQLCAGLGDTFRTPSSTIEFHLGTASAAIAFCRVAVPQARSCWERFLPVFWALWRLRARPRALRALVPWGDNLDERVLLDAGAAGSRAREMAATAVESAKENLKPPDLAKFEPLAAEIVTHGLGTPPPKSLDTAMEKAVERALRAGGVPDVGKSQFALVPPLPGYQFFDDNEGAIYYTKLVVRPRSADPTDDAVQIYVPSTSPKTGLFAYAGQTNPTVFVATPTPAPVDANRIFAALNFQPPFTFGPVNATDVGDTIVQKLTAAGFPDTAYDIMANIVGEIEIGNGGNALTTVFGVQADFQTSPAYAVQMYLNSNGTYEVNVFVNEVPVVIPVSDPEFYPFTGITSPFFIN
jgi:hypothetical protein